MSAAGVAVAQTPVQPMRYDLRVGQRWVYDRKLEETALRADAGSSVRRGREQLQLWILDEKDGEFRVLVDLIRLDGKTISESLGGMMFLRATGERRWPAEMEARIESLSDALLILPVVSHPFERGANWTSSADEFGRQLRFEIEPPDAATRRQRVVFERVDTTGASEVLGETALGQFWFDLDQRRIMRMECEHVDATRGVRQRSVVEFFRVIEHPVDWCRRRVRELDQSMRAVRSEQRARASVSMGSADERTWRDLARVWDESLATLERDADSPLPRIGAAWRKLAIESTPALLQDNLVAKAWHAQPATHWSLQNAAGQTVRSEPLRDRPMLEVYWSVKSPPSMRALETARRAQRELGDLARVVCINVDNDLDAARAAARKCGMEENVVLGGGALLPPASRTLPVARLIGEQGRVVAIWFDWQPRLAELVRGKL